MTRLRRRLTVLLLLPLLAGSLQAQRVAPKPVETPTPTYPAALVDSGRDGTATIEFTVDVDGSVKDPKVKSADDPAFADAAMAVLPQWKFQPGQRDGAPSAMKVSLPFKFAAPPEQKVNAMFGRKVYIEPTDTPVPAEEFKGPLQPLNHPPIGYPRSFLGSRREERVEVDFLITPEGRTANPTVVNEVPPDFGASAILHVAALVFEKPVHNGKPAYVQVVRPVVVREPGSTQE